MAKIIKSTTRIVYKWIKLYPGTSNHDPCGKMTNPHKIQEISQHPVANLWYIYA